MNSNEYERAMAEAQGDADAMLAAVIMRTQTLERDLAEADARLWEVQSVLDHRNDEYMDNVLARVRSQETVAKYQHDMARARVELVELRKADKEAETLVSALGASLECRVHEEEETATRESPRLRYDKALCEKAAAWLAAREGKGG